MFVDMLIFMVLAYFYKSDNKTEEDTVEESEMKLKDTNKNEKGVNAAFESP